MEEKEVLSHSESGERRKSRPGLQTLMGAQIKMPQAKKEATPRPSLPTISDLKTTLAHPDLLAEFRNYLKTLKKFEPMLDYLLLCLRVFDLPEADVDTKARVMVEIYSQFLTPKSHNIALRDQINRKALIAHCKDLETEVITTPDVALLRPSYEYVFGKVEQKHDLWRKTYKPPTTTVAALLCNII